MESKLGVLFALDRPEALIQEAVQQLGSPEAAQQFEAQLYLLLGLVEVRRLQEAEEKARAFQQNLGHCALFWLIKGFIALSNNDLKAAESFFLEGLKRDPQDTYLLAYLGLVQGLLGDLRSSKQHFNTLMRQDPHHCLGLVFMALVYGEVCHRSDLARKLLRRCLQINPQDQRALALLAEFEPLPWIKRKRLRQALLLNPFDRDARQSLGLVERSLPFHAVLAGGQILLAQLLHVIAPSADFWIFLLLITACLQASALFHLNKQLPGVLLLILLPLIFFPVQALNPINFLVAAGVGLLLIAPCYGVYRLSLLIFSAKDKNHESG